MYNQIGGPNGIQQKQREDDHIHHMHVHRVLSGTESPGNRRFSHQRHYRRVHPVHCRRRHCFRNQRTDVENRVLDLPPHRKIQKITPRTVCFDHPVSGDRHRRAGTLHHNPSDCCSHGLMRIIAANIRNYSLLFYSTSHFI